MTVKVPVGDPENPESDSNEPTGGKKYAFEAGLHPLEGGRGGGWRRLGGDGLDLAHCTRFLGSLLDGVAAFWADAYRRRNGLGGSLL